MLVPILWALLGGGLAVNFEFWARRGMAWTDLWWWAIPSAFLIQLSVWHLVRSDMGWLPSIVLFGAVTAVVRIGLAFLVLHEPVTVPNVVAGAVLVGVVGVRLVWR